MRVENTNTSLIQRPVDEVFQFLAADYFKNFPSWQPDAVEFTQTSSGPVEVGTSGHLISLYDGNSKLEADLTVREYQSNRLLMVHGEGRLNVERKTSKGASR